MALQEHLRHACRDAEIAVELKRRMETEEVGAGISVGEEIPEHQVGVLSIVKSGIERRAPCKGPLTHIAVSGDSTGIERNLGRLRQFRSLDHADLATGIDGEEMGGVAVVIFRVIEKVPLMRHFRQLALILHPLLKLPPFSDLRSDKLLPHSGDLVPILLVCSECVGCLDVIGEEIPDDLLVIADPIFFGAMFRRPAVRNHETSVGECLEMILPEFNRLLDHRIGGFLEIHLIAAECIMLPEMLAEPGIGGLVPLEGLASPGIEARADGPASGRPGGKLELLFLGRVFSPDGDQGFHPGEERLVSLRHIRRLGGPVVHLDIDVGVVVAVPGRVVHVVPETLKVRGKTAGTGASKKQITAILEEDYLQLGVERLDGLHLAKVDRQGGLSLG